MNILEVQNISKVYPNGLKALDAVSLTLRNGMFGLLGPNGAGKSSLMRIIATLQMPDSGEIYFNGESIAHAPHKIRAALGYLPQEFGVYPGISAEGLLDYLAVLKGVGNKKERKEQVQALLQKTNLYQVKSKAVSTFSGGMRQRFGIAQALLGNPKLLIADEPTAGLDPEERDRFHNLLSELSEDMIVVLSTHIVEDVRQLCTEMAVLVSGKVEAKGQPAQLIQALQGQVWQTHCQWPEKGYYQERYNVISERLKAGKVQVRVLAPASPGAAFEPAKADLEDVYFSVIATCATPKTACYAA